MTTPIPGHRVRVTAVMQALGGVTIENVYDVQCTAGGTGDDDDVMQHLAAWLDGAYTHLTGLQVNAMTYVEVRGFDVSADTPLPTVAWPSLTTGSGGGEPTPYGVAALVLFRTLKARVVGRKYLGGFNEALWASGEILVAALPAFLSFAAEIAAGPGLSVAGGEYEYKIYDKLGVARDTIASVVRSVAAYQRRRRPGRGI